MKKSLFVHWQHLLDNIFDPNKSMTTICEIGTHRGKTAEQICLYLLENFKGRFKYIGYDAFELATSDSDNDEINGKGPGNWNYANHLLRRTSMLPTNTNKKFTYKLHRGWTQSTLKENTFDLVYVDGGHSYETVKHDHEKIKNSKVVVFDDYQIPDVKRYVDEYINENNITEVNWDFVEIKSAKGLVYAFMPYKTKKKQFVLGQPTGHIQPVFCRN